MRPAEAQSWTPKMEALDRARNLIFQMAVVFMPDEPFDLQNKEHLLRLRAEIHKSLMTIDNLIETGELHANR